MSKSKFRQNTRVISGREARRIGERERAKEERQKRLDAFWALSPEERAQRMRDNEAFQRISKNGITVNKNIYNLTEWESVTFMKRQKNRIIHKVGIIATAGNKNIPVTVYYFTGNLKTYCSFSDFLCLQIHYLILNHFLNSLPHKALMTMRL